MCTQWFWSFFVTIDEGKREACHIKQSPCGRFFGRLWQLQKHLVVQFPSWHPYRLQKRPWRRISLQRKIGFSIITNLSLGSELLDKLFIALQILGYFNCICMADEKSSRVSMYLYEYYMQCRTLVTTYSVPTKIRVLLILVQ